MIDIDERGNSISFNLYSVDVESSEKVPHVPADTAYCDNEPAMLTWLF